MVPIYSTIRKESTFLLDLALRHVKGEISHDELHRKIIEQYASISYSEPNKVDLVLPIIYDGASNRDSNGASNGTSNGTSNIESKK